MPLLYRGPALEDLHASYAKQGRTDEQAPVRATASVHVEAEPALVWHVLSDVAGWSAVDPAVRVVDLPCGVAVDAPFRWRNGRARISSRFAVVEPRRELTWTGVSSGARAVHRHVLHQLGDGTTRLESEESMAGPFLTLLYGSEKLAEGMAAWLGAVKAAAERSR